MGVVYRARDLRLNRLVALKTLASGAGYSPREAERFRREAEAVARLDHPHIVKVFDVGQRDGVPFMALEYCAGGSLEARVAGRPQPARKVAALMEAVVDAVRAAHAAGIVHRDIKPANVLLTAEGVPKLTDFGLAKPVGSAGPTATGEALGTLAYMAPEQAEGRRDVGPAADVYSLGALMYALMAGRPPLVGENDAHTVYMLVSQDPVPLRRLVPQVPADLETICHRCLAKDPARRYASASEVGADLAAFREGRPIRARPQGAVERGLQWCRRNPAVAGLSASLGAALVAGAAVGAVLFVRAEASAAEAERQRAAAVEAAERSRRRVEAFGPYAEAADLLNRGVGFDRAAELLRSAVSTDPEFPEARFALGEALRQAGRPAEAAEAYLEADRLSFAAAGRRHLPALLAAGFCLDNVGQYDCSQEAFRKAEESGRPGRQDPLVLVGKAYRLAAAWRFDEARAAAESAAKLAPDFWETRFARGYTLYECADAGFLPPAPTIEAALAELAEAARLSPRQAEVHHWIAVALRRRGGPGDAARAAERLDLAIALEPANGTRLQQRAKFRLEQADLPGAEADAAEARRLGASPALMHHLDSLLADRRGDPAASFRHLDAMRREVRDWPPVMGNWLVRAFEAGRGDEVREEFRAWCERMSGSPDTYLVRSFIAGRQGDRAGAVAEARTGLRLAPYSVRLHRQLLGLLSAAGPSEETLRAAEGLLEVAPTDENALVNRARCLIALRRVDDARRALDSLERAHPRWAAEAAKERAKLGN
jgi:tetratricopeptide (TPR) repeat protein